MPTPTYIPLATKTLTATATSVTFSSISQAYRDLVLVVNATIVSGTNAQLGVKFNNDSSAAYNLVHMTGTYNIQSTALANQTYGSFGASGAYAGPSINPGFNNITQIMDFSATDKHKSWLSRSNNAAVVSPDPATVASSGRWASTAAITQITLSDYGYGATYAIGSTFTLYGIAS